MGKSTYTQSLQQQSAEPIAIVGMACRWPGDSDSPSALWDLLSQGRSGRCPVPPSRYNVDSFYHPDKNRPGSIHVKDGHFITEDPRKFDPTFFGITPQEASVMDPQQRKLLEVAYEAFESAGVSLESISGTKTGTFVGNFSWEYSMLREPDFGRAYEQTGFSLTLLSNRINYVFNLKGPSFTVDTACSSSMYATHMACSSLRNGDCSAALVGGVNLLLGVKGQMYSANLGVLSGTSTCHTFDAAADGYARADGVGALYLKRLSDAIRDGDPIRGVIRGTAVNANGKTGGITHPSADGQELVIRDAYLQAGLSTDETSYFECHGTGTPVGDPIEVEAIGRVFSAARRNKSPLLIGSVKTNLGHGEAASGLAGIMKAVLILENDIIPPTIGLVNPNPKIDFEGAAVKVVTENTPFPQGPIKRVSINSFGFGGANAHAIVESLDSVLKNNKGLTAPKPHISIKSSRKRSTNGVSSGPIDGKSKFLLTFSAHDEKTLRANIGRLAQVADKCDVHDLAHTLNNRRSKFFNRAYAIVQKDSVRQGLLEVEKNLAVHKSPARRPNVGFIFTGQGAQWPMMGKDLIEGFSSCKASVQRMDKALQELPDRPLWTIEDVLSAPPETSKIMDPALSQPMCTALQIMLVDLLRSWNIYPHAAIGHSSGEIAAAYAAGYLTASEAIILAYYRGVVVSEARTDGCMLAVGLGSHEVEQYLEGNVSIACFNSPQSVTLSGDKEDVLAVYEKLQKAAVFVRVLKTGNKAYHSPHMKAVGEKYETLASNTVGNNTRPKKIFISSVYGKALSAEYKLDTSYWRTNLESPVLFSQAVEKLQYLDTQVHHLVELGPHTALEGPLRQIRALWEGSPTYTGTLVRNSNAVDCVLKTAGELFAKNYPVALGEVNSQDANLAPATIVDLPKYAWTYTDLPAEEEPRSSYEYRFRKHKRHDLLGSREPATGSLDRVWKNIIRVKDLPWLEDHQIQNKVVLPGASYMAMAVEALSQTVEETEGGALGGCVIYNLALKSAMLLSTPSGVETILTLTPIALSTVERSTKKFDFKVVSAAVGSASWVENCCGQIEINSTLKVKSPVFDESGNIVPIDSDGSKSYQALANTGLHYGPTFRGLRDVCMDKINLLLKGETDLNTTKKTMQDESRYIVHPATIDTALQLVSLSMYFNDKSEASKTTGRLPSFVEEIRLTSKTVDDPSTHGSVFAWGKRLGLKTNIGGFHILAKQFQLEFKGLRFINFDNSAANSDTLTDGSHTRHPYLRAIWKPDIEFLSQGLVRKALDREVAKQIASISLSQVQLELLEVLDLLVHKDPAMKILQIGGGELLSKVLPMLQGDSVFKRYGKYVYTASLPSKVADAKAELGPDPAYDICFEELNDIQGEFDLIITPEASVDDAVFGVIKENRKANGKLLAKMSALSSTTVEGLEKHLGFHNHVLYKASDPIKSPVTKGPLVFVHRNDSNTKLTKILEDAARMDGWTVQHAFIKDANITKGAITVGLADIEDDDTIFEDISNEEYKGLQQLVASASSCLWVSSVGFLKAENPTRAMAFGLGRAIAVEQPSISFCNLDVQNALERPEATAKAVLRLLGSGLGKSNDYEYVEDNGLLYISRLTPDRVENKTFNQVFSTKPVLMPRGNSALYMDLGLIGDLDTIHFKHDPQAGEPLHPEMVEVDVKAVGMNAKDIHIVMGRVDAYNARKDGVKGQYFSHELSGVVSKIGSKVKNLKVGDRIMCNNFFRFGTVERMDAASCCKVDADISFTEMATMPVVYTTSIYALNHLARLQKDETILIHTGAGGVGIAAITLAKAIGAEIYTTTSSEAKRSFLQKLGIPADHIFNSRDDSFVEDIMQATDGEGVDVVLSTLTGELFYKTMKCVAPAGRFIDIGRREVLDSSKLDLNFFDKNATFSSFDVGKLSTKKVKMLLKEMGELLEKGIIAPVRPIKTFDISELAQAMRHFSKGSHIGKTVITYDRPDSVLKIEPPKQLTRFKEDATYILVGGFGGLGRSLATWMVDRGARNFIFLSRSGLKSSNTQAIATISYIKEAGGHAEVIAGDVAVLEDVKRAVKAAKKPIRGVIHTAMVLRDGLFALNGAKEFHEVTKPKVHGVMNLHQALSDTPLDFFVMFSSLSGILGTLSQSNYCAANAALDAFARHRHTLGLPASSVALGGIEEVGYIHEHPEISYMLQRNGFYPINEREFLLAVEQAIMNKGFTHTSEPMLGGDPHSSNHLITGLEPLRLRNMQNEGFEGGSYFKYDRRLAVLANALDSSDAATVANKTVATMSRLKEAKKEGDSQLTRVLGEIYIDKLSKLLLIPLDQIDPSNSVVVYGMDSMIGGELRNWLYREMGVDLSFLELLSSSITIEKMVVNIKGMLKL